MSGCPYAIAGTVGVRREVYYQRIRIELGKSSIITIDLWNVLPIYGRSVSDFRFGLCYTRQGPINPKQSEDQDIAIPRRQNWWGGGRKLIEEMG